MSDRNKQIGRKIVWEKASDEESKIRARRSRIAESIATVAESVEENPGLPILHRSLELGIPQTSLHRITNKNWDLKAYTVQLTQELKPADHQQRRVFAYWVVEMHENDPEFHRKFILSDEAHFHLGGFVNKENFCIWGTENPIVIVEKPLYLRRVTGAIYGPAESLDLTFSKKRFEQQ